ncbi:MAG: glycosyltransferase, partial [Thermodesulfobacteriota bacterium]
IDFLVSGVFASHFVNVVSPTFLREIVEGKHSFISDSLRRELSNKYYAGCAVGILNAPDPAFNPLTDPDLVTPYDSETFIAGKRKNKLHLQKMLGLIENQNAPLFFWPSRLDPIQKGCRLLADIFYHLISKYWDKTLEVVFVANGDYQDVFRRITGFHGFERRVAVSDFSESMEHLGYAASDFILMPSLFEPCGLPQMIAPIYGSLPIAHYTGGIRDTLKHLDLTKNKGNGFVFETYDSNGLMWAVDQAIDFYNQDIKLKKKQIRRIMKESTAEFTHASSARQYIELYEKMLQRPLINTYS